MNLRHGPLLYLLVGIGIFFIVSLVFERKITQTEPDATKAVSEVHVEIKDFAFSPATITVKPGTKVIWTNRDVASHNAIADDGSFATPLQGKDVSQSYVFEKVGEFGYFCGPHPYMRGKVIVAN